MGPDGVGISFTVRGSGHPVVLLHGTALSGAIWRGLGYTRALEHHFRVVTVDLRGHGRSDKPVVAEAYRREALVDDVLAVLDTLRLSAAHVVGYSLGGSVGFSLLARAPERVSSLVSFAGPFASPLGSVGQVIVPDYDDALVAGGMAELVLRWEKVRGVDFDPATRHALHANAADSMRALLAAIDEDPGLRTETVAALDSPTLFVAGHRDRLGLLAASQVAAALPGAKVRILAGRDHTELLRPAPQVLRILLPFLRANTPASDG